MASAHLNAGDQDRRITIEQLTSPEQTDPDRFPVEAWTPLVTMYAEEDATSGGDERFTGAQIEAVATTTFRIRYRADMDPDLLDVPKRRRIVRGSRIFNIVDARPIGRRVGVQLLTREHLE